MRSSGHAYGDPVPPPSAPFRVGFVTGATPDKWAGVWRRRHPRDPLELVPVEQPDQETTLRAGELDMCLVRLPVDREGLHCIPLYDEVPVVVVGKDHLVTVVEEVALSDLDEEQLVLPHESGWTPSAPQLEWPPMTLKDAAEVVDVDVEYSPWSTPVFVNRPVTNEGLMSNVVNLEFGV